MTTFDYLSIPLGFKYGIDWEKYFNILNLITVIIHEMP